MANPEYIGGRGSPEKSAISSGEESPSLGGHRSLDTEIIVNAPCMKDPTSRKVGFISAVAFLPIGILHMRNEPM